MQIGCCVDVNFAETAARPAGSLQLHPTSVYAPWKRLACPHLARCRPEAVPRHVRSWGKLTLHRRRRAAADVSRRTLGAPADQTSPKTIRPPEGSLTLPQPSPTYRRAALAACEPSSGVEPTRHPDPARDRRVAGRERGTIAGAAAVRASAPRPKRADRAFRPAKNKSVTNRNYSR
jgi:hypothetical protein